MLGGERELGRAGERLSWIWGESSGWRVTRTSTKEKKIKQHRIIVYLAFELKLSISRIESRVKCIMYALCEEREMIS